MRMVGLFLLLGLLGGCRLASPPRPQPAQEEMFLPATMRLHPIFTGVRDWSGDGQPDGIEVLLEFQDQFGDPTKALGRVIFEAFEYRPHQPDPRGRRIENPWIGSIRTIPEQREHWDRTSRTYRFQLASPQIPLNRRLVVTAIFEPAERGRFLSRIILDPFE